jgi:hypothetical protein
MERYEHDIATPNIIIDKYIKGRYVEKRRIKCEVMIKDDAINKQVLIPYLSSSDGPKKETIFEMKVVKGIKKYPSTI